VGRSFTLMTGNVPWKKKGDYLRNKSHMTAAVLLILMLLSIFLPAATLSASANTTGTAMPKTEDIFGGSFSPKERVVALGEKFDVTFSLCPTVDTPNTIISFVLPADLVKLVSGSQVWTGDLKKGEKLSLSLSLAANGEVATYVRADVEACLSGKNYRSSYYLHVATSSTGFSSVAASGSMGFGSWRSGNLGYMSAVSNLGSSRAPVNSQTPQAPLSLGTNIEVKGRFRFLDENGNYSSARYMLAMLRDNNNASWSVTQWTNGSGCFDFVVPNTSPVGRSPILDIIAEGEWDWIAGWIDANGTGWEYGWTTGVLASSVPDGWVYENNNLAVTSNAEALQAGDAVFLEMDWVRQNSGINWSRSPVIILFPFGDWPQTDGNYILLPDKSTAGWDHVAVQHEDGHCVMWALYGYFPSGSGPDPHYIFSESSGGFAMVEGWAEFMQCAVDNNTNNLADWYNGHGGNIETNDWFNCVTTGNMDGNIIEGSVASILWDILDPVNIAGDNDHMAWGFDEIFTVMKNDHPGDMLAFWNDWAARWPDNSTSLGPLCDIYWHYGINKDYFGPWGSIIINGGALYTTSRTVTLTLSADDWGAGVAKVRFSENMGNWTQWYTYGTTFSCILNSTGDGNKRIDVQYQDNAGLNSTAWTIWDDITLDTKAPTGSIVIWADNATYTNTASVVLWLDYFDATSGVCQVRYSNDGVWDTEPWEAPNATKKWDLTAGDGNKTVYYQIRDNAGSVSPTYSDSIVLDTVPPTGSIVIGPGNPTYTTITSPYLYLTYFDDVSGVSRVRYSNDGVWDTEPWEVPNATKVWSLTAGDGNKTVYYQVIDNAGSVSLTYSDSIILDTTPPTGSIVVGSGNPSYTLRTSVTLYLTYLDATSGVYQVRYSNDGIWDTEPWEAPAATRTWNLTAGNGNKTVYYQIRDNALLVSLTYSDSIVLQNPNVAAWAWVNNTTVNCVAAADVDADGKTEIVTGGTFFDGTRNVAQLVVWADSGLAVDRLTAWYWTGNTTINSIAIGDVNGDGQTDIVTGGYYYDGTRQVAQLVVWNGSSLAVEEIKTWYWTGNTVINSVALGDVDADGQVEIVTGGYYNDGARNVAQLVVWTGSDLSVDRLKTWYWTGNTVINSVAIGDVDADGQVEIVTGGSYFDGTRSVAQLVVWTGSGLAVDRLTAWYWTNNTVINSVALGDVDADGQTEIVTAGYYNDGTRNVAQLVVWAGSSLSVDRLTAWYWTSNTIINSVAIGDADADGQTEIVTGGYFNDGTRNVAQMVVWSGSSLAVESIRTWYWVNNTTINSISLSDINGDLSAEIVTGGAYYDWTRWNAQLVVWA
jgi:hypothetical protein